MGLLPVDDALDRLLQGVTVLSAEACPLEEAHGRVLHKTVVPSFDQPPFAASSMDGYAVCLGAKRSDSKRLEIKPGGMDGPSDFPQFEVIGTARAGHPFESRLQPQQAVRIFTGAPVPEEADAVVIQENCQFYEPNIVEVRAPIAMGDYIRPKGYDFKTGLPLIEAGVRLTYRHLALLASMNLPAVQTARRPRVAILATGDELQLPGTPLKAGQIVSSVPYGLKAMIESAGGEAQLLGIALDDLDDLQAKINTAKSVDILLTIGGASVGEHDLVQNALTGLGMKLDFWRIAMRPGKPLMVGSLDGQRVIGLPGNPVSAMICTLIFILPLIKAMQGVSAPQNVPLKARLSKALPGNGGRQHYMRAVLCHDGTGALTATGLEDQDSSLQALFATSNGLIVRPTEAPPLDAGELVDVLFLDETQ